MCPQVLDYFKTLAGPVYPELRRVYPEPQRVTLFTLSLEGSLPKGLPYQKLIELYLLDCAKKRKKPTMKWVA